MPAGYAPALQLQIKSNLFAGLSGFLVLGVEKSSEVRVCVVLVLGFNLEGCSGGQVRLRSFSCRVVSGGLWLRILPIGVFYSHTLALPH